MSEFSIIEKYFTPLAAKEGLKLEDDAAVFSPPAGYEIVITKDLINSGVHFIGNELPALIAAKVLRVNLSDMAAMAATPKFYLLGCVFPKNIQEKWIKDFAAGLKTEQEKFSVKLIGGDTTSGQQLSLSLTMIGYIKKSKALKRSGAKSGDDVYVSGSIGDAAIGLKILQKKISTEHNDYFIKKYHLPEPRLNISREISTIATAAVDVSDGLVADLGHICKAAKLSAEINLDKISFSKQAEKIIIKNKLTKQKLITAGDDYELVFTANKKYMKKIAEISRKTGVKITLIGKMQKGGNKVKVLDKTAAVIKISQSGFSHF